MAPRKLHAPKIPVLFVIAALLGISGTLRGGMSANAAIAATKDKTPVETAPESCPIDMKPSALVEALSERELAVSSRETEVEAKLSEIAKAKDDLKTELAKLESADAALRATIAVVEAASENDLQKLTDVYEVMKPTEASEIFATMSPEFAAGFLGRMAPSAAAGILAGLEPDLAYAISAHVAGRNANAPKE